MKKTIFAAVLAALGVAAGGCNNPGDCPGPSSITPGGSCSGDNLTCPYTLQTPSMACDGTDVDGGVATSCTCTDGTWQCPSPVSCGDDAAAGDDGGAEGGPDATVDAGGEAQAPDSSGGGDAPAEVSSEAAADAPVEALAEAASEASSDAPVDAPGN